MYHQYDRSMHPRQSILKHVLSLKESSRELEETVQALKTVSSPQEFGYRIKIMKSKSD